MRFLRWGSSRPQRHDNGRLPSDSEDRMFHTAPRVWGFYAFPRGFVSYWLLNSNTEQCRLTNRFHWIRDGQGEKVEYDDNLPEMFTTYNFRNRKKKKYSKEEKLLRRVNKIRSNNDIFLLGTKSLHGKRYLCSYGSPHFFNFSGEIWHHLEFFEFWFEINCDMEDERNGMRKIRLIPDEEVLERNGSWVKTSMRAYRCALYKYVNHIRYYLKDYWCSPKILERYEKYWVGYDWEDMGVLEVYIEKL